LWALFTVLSIRKKRIALHWLYFAVMKFLPVFGLLFGYHPLLVEGSYGEEGGLCGSSF
jgi:hypothetical protein